MVTTIDDGSQWRVVVPAEWPAPPAEMSVSAHAEIDECPRRWALSTAAYPETWSGRGYPPKLQVATLAGTVVHLALETITKELTRSGVPSLSHPSAPQVLRALGGYTHVVEDSVNRVLERFRDNPRAVPLLDYTRRTLQGRVPTLRARVQSMLSRIRLSQRPSQGSCEAKPKATSLVGKRRLVGNGTYCEVEVRAKSIGWKGKLDLLRLDDDSCEITDFKTGDANEAHRFQLKVYAALWSLDDEINPSGRAVDRLALAYEGHVDEVVCPSAREIGDLARDLVARRQACESALAARPPAARPAEERCRYCSVRHLCDAYWAGTVQVTSDNGRFGDVELKITSRHGPTSWDAVVVRARDLPARKAALLRLQHPNEFKIGIHVRVLDGALAQDPEDDTAPAIVTLTTHSEAYRLE